MDLARNEFKGPEMAKILEALVECPSEVLEEVWLYGNFYETDACFENLAKLIDKARVMTKLRIDK